MVTREVYIINNKTFFFFLRYLIKGQHHHCAAAVALRIVWKKFIRNIKKDRLTGKEREFREWQQKTAKIANTLFLKEKGLQKKWDGDELTHFRKMWY